MYISKITSGGAADKSGSISVGDHIISVNGQSIEGRGYKEVCDGFSSCRNIFT